MVLDQHFRSYDEKDKDRSRLVMLFSKFAAVERDRIKQLNKVQMWKEMEQIEQRKDKPLSTDPDRLELYELLLKGKE